MRFHACLTVNVHSAYQFRPGEITCLTGSKLDVLVDSMAVPRNMEDIECLRRKYFSILEALGRKCRSSDLYIRPASEVQIFDLSSSSVCRSHVKYNLYYVGVIKYSFFFFLILNCNPAWWLPRDQNMKKERRHFDLSPPVNVININNVTSYQSLTNVLG